MADTIEIYWQISILEQRLADMMEIYWRIRSLRAENCAQCSLIHDQVQEMGLLFQKVKKMVEEQIIQYSCGFQAVCFDLLFFVTMEDLSTINVTTQHTH